MTILCFVVGCALLAAAWWFYFEFWPKFPNHWDY